jgi:site-specific DNA recombinase
LNKHSIPQSAKRAAIYIRVSSERQAEKTSPEAQKNDCSALCESKGYTVVEVYADTERYRVGKRLVEPSGTRADRPQFKRMLADGRASRFDVIIAWREDRLYRDSRPMLDLSDLLDDTKITVELVKEHFDQSIMWIKAGVAKMELQAKHDRFMMGVAGRLEKGLTWNSIPPYGYSKTKNGSFIVNPDEAQWIQALFRWYGEGVALHAIRRRLIAGGAVQRKKGNRRVWTLATLRKFLRHEYYWTGIHTVNWDGEIFEIPIPILITQDEIARVQERRLQYKQYPAGNAKHDFLAAGLIVCPACGTTCRLATLTNSRTRKRDGQRGKWHYYECYNFRNRGYEDGCIKRINAKKTDEKIWAKLSEFIEKPGLLVAKAKQRLDELRAQAAETKVDVGDLKAKRDRLKEKRRTHIEWASDGSISKEDMLALNMPLNNEVDALEQRIHEQEIQASGQDEKVLEAMQLYEHLLREGWQVLNREPETEEEAQLQRENRPKFVRRIVKRIDIDKTGELLVKTVFDSADMVKISEPSIHGWGTDPIPFFVAVTL